MGRNSIINFLKKLRVFFDHIRIVLTYLFSPISLFLRILNFRVFVHAPNLGNLCIQIPSCAREKYLGKLGSKKIILYPHFGYLISKKPFTLQTTNNYFYSLWKQHFFVVLNPVLAFLLKPILTASWLQLERPYFSDFPNQSFYAVTREYYQKYPQFSKESALLKIPPKDQEKGWKILEKLGVKKDDWFVCFFAREPGYYPPEDYEVQGRIRNVSVETYRKALLEVIERGGVCIRIGSKDMSPLPESLAQHPRIIDYPKSSYQSEFMDVFLLANSQFLLTCGSGISVMPGLFGVPIIMTNVVPLNVTKSLYPKDLSIPKLYYSKKLQRKLSFFEAFSQYMTDQIHAYYYDALHLEAVDNSEDEVYEVTKEMLDRVEGTFDETDEVKKLYQKLDETIPFYLFAKDGLGKVGSHFLDANKELL